MPDIKEYKINVSQEKLDRLKKKLELTDWPTELEDAPEWQYGSPMFDTTFAAIITLHTNIHPGLMSKA